MQDVLEVEIRVTGARLREQPEQAAGGEESGVPCSVVRVGERRRQVARAFDFARHHIDPAANGGAG